MSQSEFALKFLSRFNLFSIFDHEVLVLLCHFATFQSPFKMTSNSKSTLTVNFSIISFLHSLPRNREVYYWIYPSFLRKLFGKSSRAAIFERCRRSRRCRAWAISSFFIPPEETREAMLSNLSIS